jgi:hypothetical protein
MSVHLCSLLTTCDNEEANFFSWLDQKTTSISENNKTEVIFYSTDFKWIENSLQDLNQLSSRHDWPGSSLRSRAFCQMLPSNSCQTEDLLTGRM